MTRDEFKALPRCDQLEALDRAFPPARPRPAGFTLHTSQTESVRGGAGRATVTHWARLVHAGAVVAVGCGPTRASAISDVWERLPRGR